MIYPEWPKTERQKIKSLKNKQKKRSGRISTVWPVLGDLCLVTNNQELLATTTFLYIVLPTKGENIARSGRDHGYWRYILYEG